MMKPASPRLQSLIRRSLCGLFGLALLGSGSLSGQVWPLSENNWRNPEFVRRFIGSYGINTAVEPSITREESELFQRLAPVIDSNLEQAIVDLRNAINPNSSAALDYTLGGLLLQSGRVEESLQSYRNAVRKFPNFLRAYKNMGLAQIQAGRYQEARTMLVKAIELGDSDGNTFGLLGFCHLSEGRHQSALDAYRIAHLMYPNNRDWTFGKIQCLLNVGENRQAIALIDEQLEANPQDSNLWVSRANAHLGLENIEAAILSLEVVRRLGRAQASVLFLLGDAYINIGLPNLALGAYRDVLAPGVTGVERDRVLRSVENLVSRQAFPEASALLDGVRQRLGPQIEADRDSLLRFQNLRASVALSLKRDQEGVAILEEIVAADPLNGRALILLADYYNTTVGDPQRADFYFEAARRVPSVEHEALIQQARSLVQRRDFARAVRLLERAQSLQPRQNVAAYLDAVRRAAESQPR